MRIDRAVIEDRIEEAKYRLGQLRDEPEKLRRIVMIGVASVVVTVTLVVWIARLLPEAPPDADQPFVQRHKTSADWVDDATRRSRRDDRFKNVAVTYTKTSIIVMGRVDSRRELVDLRQQMLTSSPPVAIQWQVSIDE